MEIRVKREQKGKRPWGLKVKRKREQLSDVSFVK